MKYSIILPVFNGGEYLKLCVHSILQQSLKEFDLLVLDSGSSDGSIEWIAGLNDTRIKIYPTQNRLTIEENWERIYTMPRNEFMTIIGHDDIFRRDYLIKIDELIQHNPQAHLYQGHFDFIDDVGKIIRPCKPMKEKIISTELLELFLTSEIDTMGTGFMMRSMDFNAVGGMPIYPKLIFSDMELWQKITAKGFLAVSKENLFSYRRHVSATTIMTDVSLIIRALDQFVDFLNALAKNGAAYAEVINKNANTLLMQYCQGLSHKVLRTPKSKRTLSVTAVLNQFTEIGKKMNVSKPFEPLDYPKIRMGKIIDGNVFLYNVYIVFRGLFGKQEH